MDNSSNISEMLDNKSKAEYIPMDLIKEEEVVTDNVLPPKSKLKYEYCYKKFNEWRTKKKIKSLSEPVFLTYFSELSEKFAPTTLWTIYSMLRGVIHTRHYLNISGYSRLKAYLKTNSKEFQSKKYNVLTSEQCSKFIKEAPDVKYLAAKVILIFGIQGGCRKNELTDLTINNIQDKNDMVLVKIPRTIKYKPKSFIITDEFYSVYKKYAALRPKYIETNRFFLSYHNGSCSKQVIGINTIGKIPKIVAKYLNLADADNYTSRTFWRTSATLSADSDDSMIAIQRPHRWKSTTTVAADTESSMEKMNIDNMTTNEVCKNYSITSTDNNSVEESTVIHETQPEINNQADENSFSSSIETVHDEKHSKTPCKIIRLNIENCDEVTLDINNCKNLKLIINGKDVND